MKMVGETPVARIEEGMAPSAPLLESTDTLQVPDSWEGPTAAITPKARPKRSASLGVKIASVFSKFSCGGAVAGGGTPSREPMASGESQPRLPQALQALGTSNLEQGTGPQPADLSEDEAKQKHNADVRARWARRAQISKSGGAAAAEAGGDFDLFG